MTQAQSKYTFRLTPKRLIGGGVLALFLLSWMFVLGLLVGRGTVAVPRKTQVLNNQLAEQKEKALAEERAEMAAQAKESQEEISRLGIWKLKEKSPANSPVRTQPTPTPVKPKATPIKPKATPLSQAAAKPGEAAAPEPKPAQKVAPTATPTPEARPAAAAPASGESRFTVQVAAFKDQESAGKLVDALRTKGYPAYQLKSGKDAWFRVRVGAFEGRPAADAMLKKLQGEKYKAVVVGTD